MSIEIDTEERLVSEGCLSKACKLKSKFLTRTIELENLEEQLFLVNQENEMYKKVISKLMTGINELLLPNNAALNLLKDRLSEIELVKALFYFISNDGIINLWVVTREENFETELNVAKSLSEVFRIFNSLRFDFMIVPLCDMNLEDILPDEKKGKLTLF